LHLEGTRGRVEGLEEAVVHRDARLGERVQEGRLADIRVPGQGDGRRLGAPSRLPPRRALLRQRLEPLAQEGDPAPREPAIRLELALAGAPGADAAAETLEVLPEAPHSREVVL